MHNGQIKLRNAIGLALLVLIKGSILLADEKIIQQEDISFSECLKVITTSQDKLLIAPKISDISDQKRVAIFKLIDGTLTITCDGVEEQVIVSTNVD